VNMITYFALLPNKNSTHPDIVAVNGGSWGGANEPTFYHLPDGPHHVMLLQLGIDIFETPEEAVKAAMDNLFEHVHNTLSNVEEEFHHMRRLGEHLHDPHLAEYTPYNQVLLRNNGLSVYFGEVASTLQRWLIQYAHILEELGDA